MAAAEMRAGWQRTANRCFVQEDAKRAPKLACCQSSSSTKPVDTSPTSAADEADHPSIGFMPFNRNPSFSDLPPDTKWWLHLQPNFGHQRGLTFEQLNALDEDIEAFEAYILSMNCKAAGVEPWTEDNPGGYQNPDPSLDGYMKGSTKKPPGEELKAGNGKIEPDILKLKGLTDYFEFREKDLECSSVSKQSAELSLEQNVLAEKVPWWRKTDRDELTSLVAQRSNLHVENCDLPPLRKMHVHGERFKQTDIADQDEISLSSKDGKAKNDAIPGLSIGDNPELMRYWAPVKDGLSANLARKPLSLNYNDQTNKARFYHTDPTKAQLLEALFHSQTRAREAEDAARQAYTENEHIIKLLFKQASHLFAYRQWFRLLQLESFLLQIQDKEPAGAPTFFPDLVPWVMPCKPINVMHRSWNKAAKGKQCKRGTPPHFDIGKYAIALALGLSLVGAGLLLGWTVGWLFRAL
ncbi:hypothetical protein Dimus_006659 [Dionaea muscipula]